MKGGGLPLSRSQESKREWQAISANEQLAEDGVPEPKNKVFRIYVATALSLRGVALLCRKVDELFGETIDGPRGPRGLRTSWFMLAVLQG